MRSALIIANDVYRDPKLRKLRAPARDAEELGRVLRDPGIGNFEVEVSSNEPEHVVRRKIATFFDDRRRDDLLLLHISSHGLKDDSGRLYFAATDTEVDHLDATAVWAEFVNRQMTNSRSQRIVLLLDCCYSGAFARGMTARAGEAVEVRERFEGSGRAVLTASSAMEYSFEGEELSGEGNPSVFTSAVVRALDTGEADRDGDHRISLDELYEYVHDQVQEITPKQTPGKWVFDVRGELYIAKRRYAGGDAEVAGPLVEERPVRQAERAVVAGDSGPSPPRTAAATTSVARRRRVGALAAALLALALAAGVLGIAGVFSGGAGSGQDESAFRKGAATVIGDVESPSALAIGAGSLWVANYDRDAISRIDLGSGKVGEKPIAVGADPTGIVVGDGAVWVANLSVGSVSKVDIAREQTDGDAIDIPAGTRPGDTIAAGDGKVWAVMLKGGVLPIDAADGEAHTPIALPGGAEARELAFGEGGLWVLAANGTVTRVDPASGEPDDPVKVAGHVAADRGQLAVGEGAVWVAALNEGKLFRIDPQSRTVVKIPFDGIDGDLAAGAGYVWVIDGTGRLVRIDPRTKAIVRSRVVSRYAPATNDAGYTNDMTAGAGALWIADLDRDTVTRVAP